MGYRDRQKKLMILSIKFIVYSYVQEITIWLKSEDLGHFRKIFHAGYSVGIMQRATRWAVNVNRSVSNSTDLEIEVWDSILREGRDLSHLHHGQSSSGSSPVSSL
jgi:hypothetical protein